MDNRVFENNQVTISGAISREAEFSHEVYGEGFYIVYMNIPMKVNWETY